MPAHARPAALVNWFHLGNSVTSIARVQTDLQGRMEAARQRLDAHVREIIEWHFNPETGSPFWLEWAQTAGWDPRQEIKSYGDLDRFGNFQDEWLRGGPVRRWVPKGYADRP